tara:strand:- start:186 stop:791 length:606 start_codon:yes stop_codon:yes gene_type:complete
MGFKVSSDNIRLQERLRLDHIATKLLPSNFPVGSIVQIATSQSTGNAGFNGTAFSNSWQAVDMTECEIKPMCYNSIFLYFSSLGVEYDAPNNVNNIYHFLKAYRCINDQQYSTAQNAYYGIDDSRQLGHAGTDLGGATGKFNFMFTDAASTAQPGQSLKYKVYVTNQNETSTIHYNQALTMVDGSNMPLTTQNYIMEIKRS